MRRVLAACCCAYAGTMLAAAFLPPAAFLPLAAVFLCLFLTARLRKKSGYTRILPLICLGALAVQGAGVLLTVRPTQALAGTARTLSVRVEQADPGYIDGTVRARLKVLTMDGKTSGPLNCFRVSCDTFPSAQPGDEFTVRCTLESLEKNQYYYSSLADGVYLKAECEEAQYTGQSRGLMMFFHALQKGFSAGARRYLPRTEGGVLAAMAAGDRSGLTKPLKTAYRAAGVSHLLVVSGLHLTLLCGAFLGNRPCGGRWRRQKAVGAMLLVVFMMGMTGFTPSVTRAGIAVLIFYLGAILLQPADSLTSLGIAAVLISLQGPYALCDLGLQLSFTATLGVILATRAARPWQERARKSGKTMDLLRARLLAVLLCPTFAALVTLPVQLANGLSVSGVSVLSNLCTMALVGPVVLCGLLAGVCGFIPWLDFAVRVFALAGGLLVRALNGIVAFFAGLPLAQLRLPAGYSLFVLAVLAAVVFTALRLKKQRWLFGVLPGVLAVAVICQWGLHRNTVQVAAVGSPANPCLVVI